MAEPAVGHSSLSSDVQGDRVAVSVWVRLVKSYNLVLREVRRRLRGNCTLPQFDVLAQLIREEKGMTFVGLSRRLLVTAGNLTGIVDRLERDGLVYREYDKSDRRVIRVRLTDKGKELTQEILPRHASEVEDILAVMTPEEQMELRELLGKLKARLQERFEPRPGADFSQD